MEADDGAIAAAIAEASGVPGVRPAQMRSERARLNPGDTFRDCPESPLMVVVPAGSFMMGSPASEEGRRDNEGTLHEVRIDYRLAVGVYPVTFDEWEAYLSWYEGFGRRTYLPDDYGWGRGSRPVIGMDGSTAKQYVYWLSRKTGKGYRLLSESEWEYVARAGTTTRYWWGDEIGENCANCDGCGSRWDGKTAPVGSFSANGFGLYDVHGNVWELVEDNLPEGTIGYCSTGADGRAINSGVDVPRVKRGGSGVSHMRNLRSACRGGITANVYNKLVGFRVARTLAP